jgi:hypothetical protein
MSAIRPLLYVLCSVLAGGCVQQTTTSHPESAMLVLDNHGGYSHVGRRIVLRSDGSYIDTGYTDFVGDQQVRRGIFTLDAQKTHLTLTPSAGEMEQLYQMDYGHHLYWVRQQERGLITDPKEDWLRQISLRVDVP